MRFHVPLSVRITRFVFLNTSGLDLLETPLWQIDGSGAKIAAQVSVLQPEGCGQRPDLGVVAGGSVVDDFYGPVVFGITDSRVAVARDFVVSLSDRGRDLVRV